MSDIILEAVNANGSNNLNATHEVDQTAQRIGLAADATAQRVGLSADATAQRIGIAELDAIGKVADEVCDSSRDIMGSVERVGIMNRDATDRTGVSSRDAIERFGLAGQAVTERTANKTQDEVEKFGLKELEAINSSEKYIYAGMSQNAKDILLFNANEFERVKLQDAANTASIKKQQYEDTKQILLQNCSDSEKILSQMSCNFKDMLLQNCNDTSSIKMQAEIHARDAALFHKDLMHQADKNTYAIQLEAFKHHETLARQLAECCCENKALILESSHKTEDLIRNLDEQRVRDELAKTREELIALRVRSTLAPSLVGAIPL